MRRSTSGFRLLCERATRVGARRSADCRRGPSRNGENGPGARAGRASTDSSSAHAATPPPTNAFTARFGALMTVSEIARKLEDGPRHLQVFNAPFHFPLSHNLAHLFYYSIITRESKLGFRDVTRRLRLERDETRGNLKNALVLRSRSAE